MIATESRECLSMTEQFRLWVIEAAADRIDVLRAYTVLILDHRHKAKSIQVFLLPKRIFPRVRG